VLFPWYSHKISFTERTTQNIRANAFCRCWRSRHCERMGENHCTNIRVNNSHQYETTLSCSALVVNTCQVIG